MPPISILAIGFGLMSLDIAYIGYPPNPYNVEYVRVNNINVLATDAVITVDQIIQYQHLTTFPDDSLATGTSKLQCGAARVWLMNSGPWTINGIT